MPIIYLKINLKFSKIDTVVRDFILFHPRPSPKDFTQIRH